MIATVIGSGPLLLISLPDQGSEVLCPIYHSRARRELLARDGAQF